MTPFHHNQYYDNFRMIDSLYELDIYLVRNKENGFAVTFEDLNVDDFYEIYESDNVINLSNYSSVFYFARQKFIIEHGIVTIDVSEHCVVHDNYEFEITDIGRNKDVDCVKIDLINGTFISSIYDNLFDYQKQHISHIACRHSYDYFKSTITEKDIKELELLKPLSKGGDLILEEMKNHFCSDEDIYRGGFDVQGRITSQLTDYFKK